MFRQRSLWVRLTRVLIGVGVVCAIPVLFATILFYRGEAIWQVAFPLLLVSIWVFGRFYLNPMMRSWQRPAERLAAWKHNPVSKPLLRLALVLSRLKGRRCSPQAAQLLYDSGVLLYEQCRYREAARKLRDAADLFSELDDRQHQALALMDLGNCENASGNYDLAIQNLSQSLRLWEQISEHQREDNTWRLLNNLCVSYSEKDDLETAEFYCRRALQNRETRLGRKNAQAATCLLNLADIRRKQKRFGEAEELASEALETLEAANDSNYVFAVSMLAMIHDDQDRCKEAESLYRQAREMMEAQLGGGHVEVARLLDRHASLLRRAGRTAEAEALSQRAERIENSLT
jgi:tetratricopeptide (TPR) repeat protein